MKIGRELKPNERMVLENLLRAIHEVAQSGLIVYIQRVLKINGEDQLAIVAVWPDEIMNAPATTSEEEVYDLSSLDVDPDKVN